MSVLVYAESHQGVFKKGALEAVSYAKSVAAQYSTTVTAVTINADHPSALGRYGADAVLVVSEAALTDFNARTYAHVIGQVAKKEASEIVVLTSSANSSYLAPLLAIVLDAGYASNVVELPISTHPFKVKRTAFSNKAFEIIAIHADVKIVSVLNNTFGMRETTGNTLTTPFLPSIPDSSLTVTAVDMSTSKVSIADADIVVSGGRGLRGPENWGMIETLADVLGAATACSKPVSDLGWRPHSEHVGQTGKPVAANLYIAIGISGAIQHLAGVNASKVKVVINTDAEAPFFKAADYGVVGDAFQVVPELIERLRSFKAQSS